MQHIQSKEKKHTQERLRIEENEKLKRILRQKEQESMYHVQSLKQEINAMTDKITALQQEIQRSKQENHEHFIELEGYESRAQDQIRG